MVGQCVFRYATKPSTVIPSMPGAPRLRLTWRSARRRFSHPSTRSMRSIPSTRASFPRVPPSVSSLSDALPRIDTRRPLLSFNPLSGYRSGLWWGESSRVFRPCRSWLVSPPTMPSADFCRPVRSGSPDLSPIPPDSRQISQGKTQNVWRVDAGFIKHTPLRMEDFAVTCPLVPGVPHLLSGSCASPRAFGLGFLQTPPRGDALALLLAFGSANTWRGDSHPARSVSCLAHMRG